MVRFAVFIRYTPFLGPILGAIRHLFRAIRHLFPAIRHLFRLIQLPFAASRAGSRKMSQLQTSTACLSGWRWFLSLERAGHERRVRVLSMPA